MATQFEGLIEAALKRTDDLAAAASSKATDLAMRGQVTALARALESRSSVPLGAKTLGDIVDIARGASKGQRGIAAAAGIAEHLKITEKVAVRTAGWKVVADRVAKSGVQVSVGSTGPFFKKILAALGSRLGTVGLVVGGAALAKSKIGEFIDRPEENRSLIEKFQNTPLPVRNIGASISQLADMPGFQDALRNNPELLLQLSAALAPQPTNRLPRGSVILNKNTGPAQADLSGLAQ